MIIDCLQQWTDILGLTKDLLLLKKENDIKDSFLTHFFGACLLIQVSTCDLCTMSCQDQLQLKDETEWQQGYKRICWSIMMMILLSSTLVFRVLSRADLICRSYIYRKFGSHFSSQQGCAASLGPGCQLCTEFMECVVMWVVLEGKLKRWGTDTRWCRWDLNFCWIFIFFLFFGRNTFIGFDLPVWLLVIISYWRRNYLMVICGTSPILQFYPFDRRHLPKFLGIQYRGKTQPL